MPVRLVEMWNSGSGEKSATGAGLTRRWVAFGSADVGAIDLATLATADLLWYGLVRGKARYEPQGGGVWYAEVDYEPLTAGNALGGTPTVPTSGPSDTTPLGAGPDGGGFDCTIDLTSEMLRVTQSRETLYRRVAADGVGPGVGTGRNYQQAIGVTKDRVEGCEVLAPKLTFSHTVPRANVLLGYVRQLRSQVATTNDRLWWGFSRGELLYLGASGRPAQDGANNKWLVTHQFAVGENELNLDVGGGITVPEKRAWDYLWCAYEEQVVGGLLLQVPAQANVERVYRETNYALLQIGA